MGLADNMILRGVRRFKIWFKHVPLTPSVRLFVTECNQLHVCMFRSKAWLLGRINSHQLDMLKLRTARYPYGGMVQSSQMQKSRNSGQIQLGFQWKEKASSTKAYSLSG